jgi:hypothetical protein
MSVEELKAAMKKQADKPENNEGGTNKGVADVYAAPAGRAPGTLDAPWGERPAEGRNGYPDVYSTGVMREARDGRGDMLERLFDSPKADAASEQRLMGGLLEHAREGAPHSPMLQRGRLHDKTASIDEPTLTDQVMRACGRS